MFGYYKKIMFLLRTAKEPHFSIQMSVTHITRGRGGLVVHIKHLPHLYTITFVKGLFV